MALVCTLQTSLLRMPKFKLLKWYFLNKPTFLRQDLLSWYCDIYIIDNSLHFLFFCDYICNLKNCRSGAWCMYVMVCCPPQDTMLCVRHGFEEVKSSLPYPVLLSCPVLCNCAVWAPNTSWAIILEWKSACKQTLVYKGRAAALATFFGHNFTTYPRCK